MNDTHKPREFWISNDSHAYNSSMDAELCDVPLKELIYVIEYSAYEEAINSKAMLFEKVLELKKERDEYREILAKYNYREHGTGLSAEVLAKYSKESK